ncbi:hypothetical protein HDU67_001825 [Dinochytrium kinnereticum]|nr:hypothetical protein HDU67_001825 [Dinochytrium kinnereticum]
MKSITACVAVMACAAIAAVGVGAALLEPEDGKFYFGAWIDMENTPFGRDSPSLINQRMGMNFSMFQMAQELPNAINFWDNGKAVANITNAETVYANNGLNGFTDQDLNELADQLYNITNLSKRDVFLRFSPEMNGNWFPFGYQPTLYISTWRRVTSAIRRRAPGVAMVWAPNLSGGYPYGGPPAGMVLPPEDMRALDTNLNGRIDEEDDPYTPYWPGDEYVDWVALSLYFKGTKASWPWRQNSGVAASNYVTQLITGGGEGGSDKYNFYDMFCVLHNKPMAIAESNAAFQVSSNATGPIDPGPGHLAIARSYWSSYLTNPAFFAQFPKIKLINLFEFIKYEPEQGVGILRDFRITRDPAVAGAFMEDLRTSGMIGRILQAPFRAFGVPETMTTVTRSATATTTATPGSTGNGSGSPGTATGANGRGSGASLTTMSLASVFVVSFTAALALMA